MAIVIKLEKIMNSYDISLEEAAKAIGISLVNTSRIKTGKVVSIRFTTLESIIKAFRELGMKDCNVGDIIEYVADEEIGSIQKGSYVSVPRDLHYMSNPISGASRKKIRDGRPTSSKP